MSAALSDWPPPVPRTTEEFNDLWDRVLSGEVPDPTPHEMGHDHCPYCGSDWKVPHRKTCAYKGEGAPAAAGPGPDQEGRKPCGQ